LVQTIPVPSAGGTVDHDAMLSEYLAFDPIVGQCSAAHAEWLRRLRDKNLYKNHGTWDEFCCQHVGLSGEQATEIIGLLEEFGPGYFNLAVLTPITPDEFRTISSKVKVRYLCANGKAIPLVPKNARRIAAAVEKLRRPAPARVPQAPSPTDPVTLLDERCRELAIEFRRLAHPKAENVDRLRLAAVLRRTLSLLGRLEMELGIY
jgi:hypothetical protein